MSLLFTRKSQRRSVTIHEERKGPSDHNSPCSTTSSTGTIKQPEFSPPRSHASTVPQSANPIWPFRARKESPSQAWIRGSHFESYTSQISLRSDPNKLQMPSPTSADYYTLHGSVESKAIENISLGAVPQSPLDGSSKTQETPTTSSIPLHPPSHSLTIRQQEPHSGQLITNQTSEDRPIRCLPTPPSTGQVPVYIPKERATRRHSPAHRIPRGQSGSRELDWPAVSIAMIEVHTETTYHYDPPLTNSSPTTHERNKSVVTMGGPSQATGTSTP
jgi:hypothetical protein